MTAECCDLLCLDLGKAEALRASRPAESDAERFAKQAAALGDPTRFAAAVALRDGTELCVCDLSWILERPDKVVSHHLRKMRAAGMVVSRRDGRMVMYSLTQDGERLLAALAQSEATA